MFASLQAGMAANLSFSWLSSILCAPLNLVLPEVGKQRPSAAETNDYTKNRKQLTANTLTSSTSTLNTRLFCCCVSETCVLISLLYYTYLYSQELLLMCAYF